MYQHIWSRLTTSCCIVYSRKYFNTLTSVTTMFNVSAILIGQTAADDVYIIRRCDQWSAVAVRVTPARSPASTDQRSTMSNFLPWQTRSCMAPGPKWCDPPDLNPSCWWHMSGSMQATFSRHRYAIVFPIQCVMTHSPAAESTRGALYRLTLSLR